MKGMEHVNPLTEFRDVEHPVFDACVNANLEDSWPNARHRFPIVGFQPLLDEVQEVSCKASSIIRKRPDVVERGSDPKDGFFRREAAYKYLYILSTVA